MVAGISQSSFAGIGRMDANLRVYIEHRPPMQSYQSLTYVKCLELGEISSIVAESGNHWRKIFVIFAKLAFALNQENTVSANWQEYREKMLLQNSANECLIFAAERLSEYKGKLIQIVSGYGYAQKMGLFPLEGEEGLSLENLGDGFYWNVSNAVIVTPYFDYRQLSNVKIDYLVCLIKKMIIYQEQEEFG